MLRFLVLCVYEIIDISCLAVLNCCKLSLKNLLHPSQCKYNLQEIVVILNCQYIVNDHILRNCTCLLYVYNWFFIRLACYLYTHFVYNFGKLLCMRMLDPIIISYKHTINVSVTYYQIQQYPVNTIYNKANKRFNSHKTSIFYTRHWRQIAFCTFLN